MNCLNVLLQLGALSIAQWTRLLVSSRHVNVHEASVRGHGSCWVEVFVLCDLVLLCGANAR
jgi:hypothetical protein